MGMVRSLRPLQFAAMKRRSSLTEQQQTQTVSQRDDRQYCFAMSQSFLGNFMKTGLVAAVFRSRFLRFRRHAPAARQPKGSTRVDKSVHRDHHMRGGFDEHCDCTHGDTDEILS